MMYKRKENNKQVIVIKSMEELGCDIIDLIPFDYKSLHMSSEDIVDTYERKSNIVITNNLKTYILEKLEEKRQEVLSLAVDILIRECKHGGASCIQ